MNFKSMILAAVFGMTSLNAMAESTVSPSMYTCHGSGLTVSYTTSSLIGRPTMNVSQGTRSLLVSDSSGSKVYAEPTTIGQLVTMFDARIADATRSYSLVIPSISLGENFEPATFDTMLIQSMAGGLMPHDFVGVRQSNKFIKVRCTANFAVF